MPATLSRHMPLGGRTGRGLFVELDREDLEWASNFSWSLNYVGGYARRGVSIGNGKTRNIYLHREIMQAPEGMEVDHINRNKLDCRRANLRIVTYAQNRLNLPGKHVHPYKGRWRASFVISGVRHQKDFLTEQEAAGWIQATRPAILEGKI